MADPVWTISNGLSALRLALAFPIAILMLRDDGSARVLLFALIALAVLTDFFDGVAARRFRQVTDAGKILDPLADKVVVATMSFILMRQGIIPLWFFTGAIARDLCLLAGGWYLRKMKGFVLQSNVLGKWTVTSVAALLIVSLAGGRDAWLYTPLLVSSTALLLLSFLVYLQRFVSLLRSANAAPHTHAE